MSRKFHVPLLSLITAITVVTDYCCGQDRRADSIEPLPKVTTGDVPINPGARPQVFLIDDGLSVPRSKEIDNDSPTSPESVESREAALQTYLTGAKLKGQFTMDGKPLTDLQDETYEIRKAHKLKPDGDTWAIHARIKYGQHDVVVPVPIKILWAGNTPILSMDKMAVPGLGTFSARVVLHNNRYAGTWQHDDVGGHLFGTIEPAESQPEPTNSGKESSEVAK